MKCICDLCKRPARNLYDVARAVCHSYGAPWTDPRTLAMFKPQPDSRTSETVKPQPKRKETKR